MLDSYNKKLYNNGYWRDIMNINAILSVCEIIISFVLVLIISKFLPKYFQEKAKNLATKEDIKDITKKTEEVKIEFQEEFFNFSKDNKFRQEFYYKRYAELYSKLYTIIAQSEYIRYFFAIGKEVADFKEYPFFEIVKHSKSEKKDLFTQEVLEHKEIKVHDSITSFNKKEISEYIIERSDLASRRLLKLAVAYRYTNDNYSGSGKSISDPEILKQFDEEEIRIIREIVKTIIIDYNQIAKELKMEYSEDELNSGIFALEELKSK